MKYISPGFFIVFSILIIPYCFHLLNETQQSRALSSDISTLNLSELNLIESEHISSDFVITSIITTEPSSHIISEILVSPLNDPTLIYNLRFNNNSSQDDFTSSISLNSYDKLLDSKVHIVGSTFIWPAASSQPTLFLVPSSIRLHTHN